ncbi:uncharacterized protein LOC126811609 [Patella vulgata]|uniref:uncharacterized protein LOC126811609 n=1 Tax=Patella vulgata TaxID=6465 RepID=UPI00217FC27E|nr:uncharacterized protein LOC126811609 [Patella vulgata]
MRNPNTDKENGIVNEMAVNGASSLDVSHVQCNVHSSGLKGEKIKRLMRADSDLSDKNVAKALPPRPFLKELKRQNSVGDVLSVILNKSRAQINSLFTRKLMSSERRQSQSTHFDSLNNFPDFHETKIVAEQNMDTNTSDSPIKHCHHFSSVLSETGSQEQTTSRAKVPVIKPSLSPTFKNIQSGQLKPHIRTGMDASPNRGPRKILTKNHSIDFPISSNASSCSNQHAIYQCGQTDSKSHLYRILSYLYLGSIESAYNEPALCKANINALVDIANVPPNFSVPGRKLECPCFCIDKLHFRSKLYIAVDDIEWESMEQYFEEINNFIEGARKCHKSVLIYSYHGKSRSAAAIIQYLMSHYKISLDLAFKTVKRRKPDIVINQGLWKALERLDRKIIENEKMGLESFKLLTSTPPSVRNAWLDC